MRKTTRKVKEPEFNYLSKKEVTHKLRRSTRAVQQSGLIRYLRKNGFSEAPLEEIHERLYKIRRSLSQVIVVERNGVKGPS